jgi:DNA-binding transcriptional ArsR family regulator
MKSPSPALLPLLRSRAQGDILTWIMLHPDQQFSLTQIAEAVAVSAPTVMREVDRLVDAGLVRDSRAGNQRLVQAETASVVYRPLADLLLVTFGPRAVLRELLEQVPGIERALIYGSWAARYDQQPGTVPGDIDVMIIGTPDRSELDTAIEAAEARLRREVNVRQITPEAWAASPENDPFRKTVLSRPVVDLIGDHRE